MADIFDPNYWANRFAAATGAPSGGSSSGQQQGSGLVYWGSRGEQVQVPTYRTEQRTQRRGQATIPDLPGRYPTQVKTGTRPETKVSSELRYESEVRGYVYSWHGTEQYDRLADRLVGLGLIEETDKADLRVLDKVWQDAVDLSMRMSEVGKRVSPWQALELLGGMGYGNGPGGGRGGFSGSKTTRQTSVDLTDPMTAKAIVNDALSRYLGRAANDDELRTLTGAINSAERSNPATTVTTTQYDNGDATSSSSTTSGGITQAGRQQVVADNVMERPEYGAYQAAATYFPALAAAIQSPV